MECNLRQMKNDDVLLVRRRSGGGAVYHDLGNANYCAITSRADFHRSVYSYLMARALETMDIPATVNSRFDILLQGTMKISGSAYKIIKDRAYHHGTMLIDTESDAIMKYQSSLAQVSTLFSNA